MGLPPVRQKFPDPDKHVAKKELSMDIRKAIQGLHKRLRNREAIVSEEILRFQTFINPGNNYDASRLPIVAKKPTSPKPSRAMCLYYKLSWLIQLHWNWLRDESAEIEAEIQSIITWLNELDYFETKIAGNDKDGYSLENRG